MARGCRETATPTLRAASGGAGDPPPVRPRPALSECRGHAGPPAAPTGHPRTELDGSLWAVGVGTGCRLRAVRPEHVPAARRAHRAARGGPHVVWPFAHARRGRLHAVPPAARPGSADGFP